MTFSGLQERLEALVDKQRHVHVHSPQKIHTHKTNSQLVYHHCVLQAFTNPLTQKSLKTSAVMWLVGFQRLLDQPRWQDVQL